MNRAIAFEHAVHATIAANAAVAGGDRLLVACSGGADSTALLAVLEALCRRGELAVELAVAHLNHHMRGAESDRDAAAVRALADSFGLPCFVGDAVGLGDAKANREAQARATRFAFLRRVAGEWGAARIALAHTRDDQAETVLLRLARGAGPASLGAMQVSRADGVVRPLLEQSRAACVEYLLTRGLGWVEDSSNEDESFFRNRVRRRLLPVLEAELGVDVRQRLARFASQLRQESTLAEQRIADLLGDGPPGGSLARAAIRAAGSAAPRLVHAWLGRAGVRATERQIDAVLRVAAGATPSAGIDLGAGIRVVRRYEQLELQQPSLAASAAGAPTSAELAIPGRARVAGWQVSSELPTELAPAYEAASGAGPDHLVLDVERLRGPLLVRSPTPGDRVRLVYGRRKLADILIDAKVPRQERKRLAVVSSGDVILWVPGVVRSVVAGPCAATRSFAVLHAERVTDVE